MNNRIKDWFIRVNSGCEQICLLNPDYPDYYVFQSDVTTSPDLLIVGANPAGEKKYVEALKEKNKISKSIEDLKYSKNQYIENPNWNISKPIIKMFSNKVARSVLENSMIMNVVYFNSNKVSDLTKFQDGRK